MEKPVLVQDGVETKVKGRDGGLYEVTQAHPSSHSQWGPAYWEPATPPEPLPHDKYDDRQRTTGRMRSCSYCGSMHPADIAGAIKAGAVGHWADWKYGWPHKAYFGGVPNPHAGLMETRGGGSVSREDQLPADAIVTKRETIERTNPLDTRPPDTRIRFREQPRPAAALSSQEKFYTVHLIDATDADRAVIEQHLGLHFTFENGTEGRVSWVPWANHVQAHAHPGDTISTIDAVDTDVVAKQPPDEPAA